MCSTCSTVWCVVCSSVHVVLCVVWYSPNGSILLVPSHSISRVYVLLSYMCGDNEHCTVLYDCVKCMTVCNMSDPSVVVSPPLSSSIFLPLSFSPCPPTAQVLERGGVFDWPWLIERSRAAVAARRGGAGGGAGGAGEAGAGAGAGRGPGGVGGASGAGGAEGGREQDASHSTVGEKAAGGGEKKGGGKKDSGGGGGGVGGAAAVLPERRMPHPLKAPMRRNRIDGTPICRFHNYNPRKVTLDE